MIKIKIHKISFELGNKSHGWLLKYKSLKTKMKKNVKNIPVQEVDIHNWEVVEA